MPQGSRTCSQEQGKLRVGGSGRGTDDAGQWGSRSARACELHVRLGSVQHGRLRDGGAPVGTRGVASNPEPVCSPQLCVILEPMQELMSRHKTYSLSPRDCLKTCLFQKWQRMVAPPGESALPAGLLGADGRRAARLLQGRRWPW